MNWDRFWASCHITFGVISCVIAAKLYFMDNDFTINTMKLLWIFSAIFNFYRFLIHSKES